MSSQQILAKYYLYNHSMLYVFGTEAEIEKFQFKVQNNWYTYKKSDFNIDTLDELEELFDETQYMIEQAINSIPANVQVAYDEGILYSEKNEMFEVELLYYVENLGNSFLPKMEFTISVPGKRQLYLLYGLPLNPIGSDKLRQSNYVRMVDVFVRKLEADLDVLGKPYGV